MALDENFVGVWIPRQLFVDDRLSFLEKTICVVIDYLDVGNKGCRANNREIAEFCLCSVKKVQDAVARLNDCGYIDLIRFDHRTRLLKSKLRQRRSNT